MSDPSWFVSLLTPNAPAGVAVIELRGAGVSIALERVGAGIGVPGSFALVHLWSHGERLDEALVCTRALDRVELHVHGSVPLVQEIVEILKPNDELAVAEPLTLQQACWLAMSEAPSEWGARIALAQSEGLLEREIQRLVDLPDAEFLPALAQLEAHGRRARRWLEPTRIALQGPPNAGKSTLFNALMGYTRVVTSGEAGTTRDPVLEATLLGTWPVELVDTAGLRPVDSQSLEGRGQSLGQRLAREAEVVFHLVPHGEGADAPEGTHALITHGDRPGAPQTAIDALNQPLAAVDRVAERLTVILDGGPDWQLDWAAPCTHGQRQVVSQAVSSQEPGGAKRLLRGLLG